MRAKQKSAIELLLCHPEPTVAKMLRIRLSTLQEWIREESFAEALRTREREQAATARRLAGQAVVISAVTLCKLASDASKPDAKTLLDLLKASGSFETEAEDPGAELAEVIRRARKGVEEAHAEQL